MVSSLGLAEQAIETIAAEALLRGCGAEPDDLERLVDAGDGSRAWSAAIDTATVNDIHHSTAR